MRDDRIYPGRCQGKPVPREETYTTHVKQDQHIWNLSSLNIMDKHLLEKYWNAETSLDEEKQLMDELAQENSSEAQYFALIANARKDKSLLTIDDIDAYNLKQTLNVSNATVRPLYRWM